MFGLLAHTPSVVRSFCNPRTSPIEINWSSPPNVPTIVKWSNVMDRVRRSPRTRSRANAPFYHWSTIVPVSSINNPSGVRGKWNWMFRSSDRDSRVGGLRVRIEVRHRRSQSSQSIQTLKGKIDPTTTLNAPLFSLQRISLSVRALPDEIWTFRKELLLKQVMSKRITGTA